MPVWKELLGIYMPWVKLDGDIPFYADGEGWQRQTHIYVNPVLLHRLLPCADRCT